MFEIKSYDANFIILKRDFFFFFEKILMGHFREKKILSYYFLELQRGKTHLFWKTFPLFFWQKSDLLSVRTYVIQC